MKKLCLVMGAIALGLGGCAVAKTTGAIISAPVMITSKTAELTGKTAYGTTKFVGNSAIGTGKIAGKTVIGTGKIAGKTVMGASKAVYYIGSTPVHIADGVLDTTNKVLRVTTQVVDLSGNVVSITRDIQAVQLNAELMKYRGAKNILDIFVGVAT